MTSNSTRSTTRRGYAPGVPAQVEVPEVSLVDVLDTAVAEYGDRVALDFYGATTTYRDLDHQVSRAAAVLQSLGVRAGDPVALVLPSCPQHVVAFYAALTLGAVVVEHNPLNTAEELRRTFADHGARVAVVWDRASATVAGLDLGHDLAVLAVDLTRELPLTKRLALRIPVAKARESRQAMTTDTPAGTSWDDAVRRAGEVSSGHRPAASDLALLQYTGGTTGHPKAAMLTHRNLVANMTQSVAWVPDLHEGQQTVYGVLPLFHAYGMLLCLLCTVRLGATLVLFPRFDVDQVLAAMKRRPATFLPAVPPVYARLADAAEERGIDLTSIHVALSGAMPLPPELVERWERLTGGLLVEGYGMTETSPIALGNPLAPTRRPGSVGLPFPSTDIRVVDPADPSVDRPAGEPGELLVRGPQVFAGYWKDAVATDEVLLEGGWLRTGDVVVVDEEGFVTVVDRIKDVIITGGFNVYPSEVEDVLRSHPLVRDIGVIGLPGAAGSEDVVAAVVAEPGLDLADLAAFAHSRLTGYKVPRTFYLVDDLPLSPIGKLLRKDLRAQLAERLAG
jgi:long-chain acyl-CoA synthetase